MMKAEPSEIKIESATVIRPILMSRYCHPTFDPFGAPRSKQRHDGGENEEKMMKAEPSEIGIESATAIRPMLITRYRHPTFDRFGAPRSKQRHRSKQTWKIDFGRQRKNQRRASKHVLGPRKSRSISVRKHGANAV